MCRESEEEACCCFGGMVRWGREVSEMLSQMGNGGNTLH